MSEHILTYLGNQNSILTASGGVAIVGQNFVAVSGVSPVVVIPDNLYKQGRQISVSDYVGEAANANITVSGESAATINGAATYVLNAAYETVTLVNTGTSAWVALNTQS